MSESDNGFRTVAIRSETWDFAENTKPDWMPVSTFVDGVVWAYYGSEMATRPLTTRERDAVYRLLQADVHREIIADAFGISQSQITALKQAVAGAKGGEP